MIVLDMLLTVFLETTADATLYLVLNPLMIAGMWFIFQKCGLKGWRALIPCVKYARLGQVADRESEGRVAMVLTAVTTLIGLVRIVLEALEENASIQAQPAKLNRLFRLEDLTDAVGIVFTLILLVYMIRIFIGLCETFGRKKRWILGWLFIPSITALVWGLSPIYMPNWTVQDLRKNRAANFFSDTKAAVMDQGLTVNLEERTATEAFKKKYLLRDIHMYIRPGRMVLLLGGSGAGKTTFLNAVNGYEKAKAEVVLNGRNMYKDYKDMKYDIGFVPQQDLMRGSDSVLRTLMDAAAMRLPLHFTKEQRRARVDEVMNIFGLTPVKDNLVVKLSGGQRKRLSIAMEFISNPALFILDEPDSGLDGVMARELFQQLRRIADQGKIIIVITHTPDRVIDLFDDVIVLAKDANRTGRLAFYGPIAEARTFFGKEKMEEIVKSVNRAEEGGEGRADEFIVKYTEEVQQA